MPVAIARNDCPLLTVRNQTPSQSDYNPPLNPISSPFPFSDLPALPPEGLRPLQSLPLSVWVRQDEGSVFHPSLTTGSELPEAVAQIPVDPLLVMVGVMGGSPGCPQILRGTSWVTGSHKLLIFSSSRSLATTVIPMVERLVEGYASDPCP